MARLVHAEIHRGSAYEVSAFCVDREYISGDTFLGIPIVPFDELSMRYPPDAYELFVAVGYAGVNRVREERYLQAKDAGYRFPTIIAKTAVTYPDLEIGENCMIGNLTVIHPQVRIGNNVLIGSTCNLNHDLVVGDHCFFSDRVAISGRVSIGPNCFFGTGAIVRNGVSIGRESVIGAATAIMEDVAERSVYFSETSSKLAITSDRIRLAQ